MYVNKIFDPIQSKTYVWDSDILDWVAWDGSVAVIDGGGGDVNILNWPASQTIDDGGSSITVDGFVSVNGSVVITDKAGMAIRVDEASSTVTYVGEADPGTAEDSGRWRIKKIDTTSGISITWANGDTDFDNRWDQRALSDYS